MDLESRVKKSINYLKSLYCPERDAIVLTSDKLRDSFAMTYISQGLKAGLITEERLIKTIKNTLDKKEEVCYPEQNQGGKDEEEVLEPNAH